MQQIFADDKVKMASEAARVQKEFDDYSTQLLLSSTPNNFNVYTHNLSVLRAKEKGQMAERDIKKAIGAASLSNDALTAEIIMYTDQIIEELTEHGEVVHFNRFVCAHTSARIASHHLVTCAHNIPKHARAQRKLKSVDPSVKPTNGKGKLKVS